MASDCTLAGTATHTSVRRAIYGRTTLLWFPRSKVSKSDGLSLKSLALNARGSGGALSLQRASLAPPASRTQLGPQRAGICARLGRVFTAHIYIEREVT